MYISAAMLGLERKRAFSVTSGKDVKRILIRFKF